MPERPLISVALCTYNGQRFLPEQLDSLLSQDYPNLEVVAVDDASSDATWALLQAGAARDPRLRLHRNERNLGFRANFEEALRRCRGELIAPSDQDDVWRADKLRLLEAALGTAAAVYCDSELVDGQGRPMGRRLSRKFPMGPIGDPAAFLFDNCVSGHALLLRRSILGRALPLPEGVFHDWWLGFVAAAQGGIAYVAEPLVQYRQHAAAVTDIAGLRRTRHSERPRGHALGRLEADERRLRAFASRAPMGEEPLFARVLELWLGWKEQFLSPRLALFLLRRRHRIFALKRDARLRRARNAIRFLWGLRLKRVFQPRAYGAPAPRGE